MTQDLSDFRPSRIWRRLPADRRLAAAQLFWKDEQSTEQQVEAIAAIAAHMKFRTKTLFALPDEKKSKYLSTLPNVSDSIAARALVNYHLETQRAMMAAFLDGLGITHENGLINEENVQKPEPEKLKAAADDLVSKFPEPDVRLYFSTLVSQDPDTWGGLTEVLESQAAAGS